MNLADTFSPIVPNAAFGLPRPIAAWLRALRAAPAAVAAPGANELPDGECLWIERPLARKVHCLEGTLWLTFDGEPQDHVLEAGQSLRCPHPSRLGIQALSAARVRVE